MSQSRLIVVGGVAAGMSAASRARRLDPEMEILVFEQTGHVSYGSCGLPYFVADLIKQPEDLVVYTPEFFRTKRQIEVHTHHRVEKVEPAARRLTVRNLDTGQLEEHGYDRLLLSTGGSAALPPVPGVDLAGVHTLRNVEDGMAIKAALQRGEVRKAVIVGGGYIGLEMAEALAAWGVDTTLVELLPQLMTSVDADLAGLIQAELERQGVRVLLENPVQALDGDSSGRVRRVVARHEELEADFVLLAAGVRPNAELARAAGIDVGSTGAIVTDDRMQTSVDGIWAAGDGAEVRHRLTGRPVYIPLGTTANKQGRVAGANIAGLEEHFPGVVGTAIVKVFDLGAARTGLSTAEAQAAGFKPVVSTVEQRSKAGYYPGGGKMTVRLVSDAASGRLLGGQMLGPVDAVKRIDTLAAAVTAELTAAELYDLDLAYAPPFAPVWDPVLMAARQTLKDLEEV